MREQHSILLAGIGGDSHSVGLTILRQSLSLNGFNVVYRGIQSQLEDLFSLAGLFNVVMLSNMDGHAAYYLQRFPELKRRYPCEGTRWYLGGNLHIGDSSDNERLKYRFSEMGFDRVFVRFVEIEHVLATLEADLAGHEPRSTACLEQDAGLHYFGSQLLNVSDEKLEPTDWQRARRAVLERWKNGQQARDLAANAEFLARQPSFADAQARIQARRLSPLMQPRCGVARVERQIELFSAFKRAGVQVLSYQVDSLTRNEAYGKIEESLRYLARHREEDGSLNGFPVVNHGVPVLRQVSARLKVPLQTRHSTRDPRLLAEISYAGGVTSFEGGCICYNIPYYKDYPLQESIRNWQYVDYLTGLYYSEFGIKLDREFFGVLTGTLIPPCLAILTNVLESLLAAAQGVKCLSLGYAEQGNRAQDIAAVRVLGRVARQVLDHAGHSDVQVNTVFSQYMAAFPQDVQRAQELIYQSAITATLARATRIIIKTPVEAYKIPALTDNLLGIGLVAQGISSAVSVAIDEERVRQEEELITREFQALFESVMFCGHGSLTKGIVEAFHRGYIDIPFAPSLYNKGKVMTARDATGAIRFLSCGELALDKEIQDFHREKMRERRAAEGVLDERQGYLLVERDVLRITRNQFASWPLDGAPMEASGLLVDR
ncbi:methylaspartate mutase subunit E [Dictyobacter aurantiacus]|uniref:B12-binding domain-containing protein n=1 Tax=Dictyobacter aurantiacus TaxID=1936993 RepID=A0A401ZKK9_9CHLR|nr:methylaspartate mutase subunit E [Dictyobacter aurantiacus]GCE07386.1 hypothetical protein KDAU_47150 [Dictyobacter aurantiacus]